MQPAFLVGEQGPVVPGALPQFVDDVGVLVGPQIPFVVLLEVVVAEVSGRVGQAVGDDVPGDAPAGSMVEGGDLAGEIEWVILQNRTRDGDAEIGGVIGDRRGDRL